MKKFDWIFAIIKVNWANMLQNRGAFFAMMACMCLQNLIYFSIWVVIFAKVSTLRGWGLKEVAFLYASGAFGYGLFFSLLGGLNQLGQGIQDGELDIHLGRPRSPLVLALLQRVRADSLGDILTGVVMLSIWVRPPVDTWPLLAVLVLTAGLVYASFRLILHSLAFWGMSGEASENGFASFIITSTNPQKGFGPWMKFILLTVFPAGYAGLLPVEILRNFSWGQLGLQVGGALVIFMVALWVFNEGLKRYASGNRFLVLR